jgi:ATP-dependent protease ClpP protease subunit
MNKLIKIAAVSTALLAGSCTALGPKEVDTVKKEVTHRLSSDFSFQTTDSALEALERAENKFGASGTFKLVITSPGGFVVAYKTLLHRLSLTPMHVKTVVHTGAYSAGAFTFILGDERIMSEDSEIMFHNARIVIRNVVITAKKIEDFFKRYGDVVKRRKVCNKAGKCFDMRTAEERILDDIGVETLKRWWKSLKESNDFIRQVVVARLGEEVADKILIEGEDVYLTAKEALELGIATSIYKVRIKRIEKHRK